MYVIPFVNQKGGVGKSTLSLNVGDALGRCGLRVILIDLDPQATTTAATLGPTERHGSADILDYCKTDRLRLADAAVSADGWHFTVVPTSYEALRQREAALLEDVQSAQFALMDSLAADEDIADVVLIDCPPNYGPLTSTALVAANGIIAPIEPAGESTHGLALLERRIAGAKRVNSQLASLGIVIIGYQSRMTVDKDVFDFVREDTSFGFVRTVRQTNGFRRAFIERKPLHAIAATDAERGAVGEIEAIAAEIARLVQPAVLATTDAERSAVAVSEVDTIAAEPVPVIQPAALVTIDSERSAVAVSEVDTIAAETVPVVQPAALVTIDSEWSAVAVSEVDTIAAEPVPVVQPAALVIIDSERSAVSEVRTVAVETAPLSQPATLATTRGDLDAVAEIEVVEGPVTFVESTVIATTDAERSAVEKIAAVDERLNASVQPAVTA